MSPATNSQDDSEKEPLRRKIRDYLDDRKEGFNDRLFQIAENPLVKTFPPITAILILFATFLIFLTLFGSGNLLWSWENILATLTAMSKTVFFLFLTRFSQCSMLVACTLLVLFLPSGLIGKTYGLHKLFREKLPTDQLLIGLNTGFVIAFFLSLGFLMTFTGTGEIPYYELGGKDAVNKFANATGLIRTDVIEYTYLNFLYICGALFVSMLVYLVIWLLQPDNNSDRTGYDIYFQFGLFLSIVFIMGAFLLPGILSFYQFGNCARLAARYMNPLTISTVAVIVMGILDIISFKFFDVGYITLSNIAKKNAIRGVYVFLSAISIASIFPKIIARRYDLEFCQSKGFSFKNIVAFMCSYPIFTYLIFIGFIFCIIYLVMLFIPKGNSALLGYRSRLRELSGLYDDVKIIDLEKFKERRHGQTQSVDSDPNGQIKKRGIPWQGKQPIALICASGGGIRAAAWSTAVITALEQLLQDHDTERQADLMYRTPIITGASGGMVGASYLVANLQPPKKISGTLWRSKVISGKLREPINERAYHWGPAKKQNAPVPINREKLIQRISQDSLSDVVHYALFRDFFTLALPAVDLIGRMLYAFFPSVWPFRCIRRLLFHDRGQALQDSWKEHLHDALERKLDKLWEGERQGWRPSLIFSPMTVESGRRLLISNLSLKEVSQARFPEPLPDGKPSPESEGKDPVQTWTAIEFSDLFPNAKIKVATAARLSASFAYVSPAVSLPTRPRRRVVDAGYYDNYGVNLAVEWLRQESKAVWFKKKVSGVVIIQIRAKPNVADRIMSVDGAARNQGQKTSNSNATMLDVLSSLGDFFLSPLSATLAAADAVPSFFNDEALEKISMKLNDENRGKDFLRVATFELPIGDISTSWVLTELEKKYIRIFSDALLPDDQRMTNHAEPLKRKSPVQRCKECRWKGDGENRILETSCDSCKRHNEALSLLRHKATSLRSWWTERLNGSSNS